MQHKLLRISSRDRTVKSDPTHDFKVTLSNIPELHRAKSIIVKQITIPHVFYNIDENNRSFTYKIAGTPTTVQITAGQYTITTLITALQTALAAITPTITQNATTLKLTLASTTAIEYLDITENPMAGVLGIESGGSAGDVTSYVATGLPSLEGVENVFVQSQTLAQNNSIGSDEHSRPILAVVPLTVPFGGVEHYLTQHSDIEDVDASSTVGKPLTDIDIKLLDSQLNTLDLHGHHVTIILKLYY